MKAKAGILAKVSLAVILASMVSFVTVPRVNATTTLVFIWPSSITIYEVGQTSTVDLNIADVTNLYGYEIKIWYLNGVVNATQVVRPSGHLLEPQINPNNFYSPKWEIKNDYNATHGRIWIAYTLLAPEKARSGSGILVRITFKGVSIGQTPIILNNYPGTQGPVKLADNTALPIPHQTQDGSIIVIPEFSSAVLVLTILLTIQAAYIVKIKHLKF